MDSAVVRVWVGRLASVAWWLLVIDVVVLAVTAVPFFLGHELHGLGLIAHMMASGVMVGLLPVVAATYWWRADSPEASAAPAASPIVQSLFAAVMVTGWVTVATMFLVMIPIASTGGMHEIVRVHGWIGYVTTGLVLVLAVVGRKAAGRG